MNWVLQYELILLLPVVQYRYSVLYTIQGKWVACFLLYRVLVRTSTVEIDQLTQLAASQTVVLAGELQSVLVQWC